MKQSTYKLLVLLLTLVIVVGGSVLAYQTLGAGTAPAVPDPEENPNRAPDFTVMDSSEGAYHLSDFAGKPVVLNFWSSRCLPCKDEMPVFQQLWEEYGDQVQFMMVNLTDGFNDTFRSAMEFVEREGYTMPIYFDLDSSAAAAFQVTSMPLTYFIDSDGIAVAHYIGAMSEENLRKGIDAILAD